MSTIKVQIIGGASASSIVNTNNFTDSYEMPLTFHAFSDLMKARIIENMIKSPCKIGISFTDETPRIGEWHEPLIENAVFNRLDMPHFG
jgi:hypothetical protein